MEMNLTGVPITAQEAASYGLVSKVCLLRIVHHYNACLCCVFVLLLWILFIDLHHWCYGTVPLFFTVPVPVPTFYKLRFRHLISYGSGSGVQKNLEKFLPFYIVSIYTGKKLYQIFCKMWLKNVKWRKSNTQFCSVSTFVITLHYVPVITYGSSSATAKSYGSFGSGSNNVLHITYCMYWATGTQFWK